MKDFYKVLFTGRQAKWAVYTLFFLSAFLVSPAAQAQLFSNDITDGNPSNDNPFVIGQVTNANITASGIGRGAGIAGTAAINRYNTNSWGNAAFDANKYFTFTITPNSGYLINYSNFNVTLQKSNATNSPQNFVLRSSLDGFTTNIAGTVINFPGTSAANFNVSLAAAGFQNVSASIEFRLYGYTSGATTATCSVNDFIFSGTVVQAPTLYVTDLTGFGNICTGTTPGTNTFDIDGVNLTAANVTVGPLAGYQFSTDNANFFNNLNLAHAPGAYSQTIYVRFSPTLVQSYNGNIPVAGGGAIAVVVPVTGSGVNTPPTVTIGSVSAITSATATVTVSITATGCTGITGYGIEYSTTPGFANGTGTQVPSSNLSGGIFSVNLTGLAAGVTYYFHTYATNNGGTTYGTENSFTTLPVSALLVVPGSGAGSLSPFGNVCINVGSQTNTFRLNGYLLNGSNIVIGPLAGYSFSTSAGGPFTATLSLVNAGTPYSYTGGTLSNCTVYVRFSPTLVQPYNGNIPVSGGGAPAISVAATGAGINSTAVITTGSALFIQTDGATLPGIVTNFGCGNVLSYGFEYSTVNGFAPGTGTVVNASNLSGNNFSSALTGLASNTVYYYYAFLQNSNGTTYGSISSFITGTVPSAFMIQLITPGSPTALAPFSIRVTAVDNLTDRNPINVTVNTAFNIFKFAGVNVLTPPATPAGVIPAGGNSITIPGFLYNIPEAGVGIRAVFASGMALANSQDTTFNVVAYTGPTNFIWNNSTNTAWLTNTNWFGSPVTAPGVAGAVVNNHLASFTSQSTMRLDNIGGVGLNMTTLGGSFNLGAFYMAETYNGTHANGAAVIGTSVANPGTINLHGAPLNNVGGIAGNNHTSLLIGNYMNTAGTTAFDIRNTQGSGSSTITLNIASPGSIVIGPGRTVNINVLMTGSQDITVTGGGNLQLFPSGAGTVNSYSGAYTIANGTITAGSNGAFKNNAPYTTMVLGSAPANAGKLKMNGKTFTLGGVSTIGTGGINNTIDNGNANSTLTINTAASTSFNFAGSINNGSSGILTLVKTGAGTQILSGFNTYTGLTTVSNGFLVLAQPGGTTIPSTNSVLVNGGNFQVGSNQTLNDLTLSGNGRLIVDAGVTLTITGNFTAATGTPYIVNNGTIILRGTTLQTFPGTASVTTMNNLTIWDAAGVNMNASLNVGGVLNLVSGLFTVGANTLTINNPIAGTVSNLVADNTSSITIAGTAANVNLPSVVTQLKNFTVSNSNGTTLQGNLNVQGTVLVTTTAGTVQTGLFTFNGPANLTMTGGNLYMEKNGVVLPEFTGLYTLTGGTVTFAGVGVSTDAQTVRPVNYFNLVSDLDGDRILGNSNPIGVSNNFVPQTAPYSNAYTITGSTIDFNKLAAQNIPAFTYFNVRFSGGSSVVKTLIGHINVKNTLSMAAVTRLSLANFNVNLKSDINGTARVDQLPTANVFIYGGTGRFVVERFLPTGVNHQKGWQLLAAPSIGQTVKQAWQEGATGVGDNPNPGFGIQLTSDLPNATTLGFDIQTPSGSGAGIKTYNPAGNNYVGISNTNALQIGNRRGYMVFVRGDRTVTTSAAAATPVTLRTTGRIYAPGADAPISMAVGASQFESVGNPYASAIDFTNLLITSTGIDETFYVWDPLLYGTYGYGTFQTFSSIDGYLPHPGGTANYPTGVPVTKIESGQAFFVYSTPGGNVNFAESNKTDGSRLVYRGGQSREKKLLNAYLYSSTNELVDGNMVAFDPSYSNTIDAVDAIKLSNFGEGFGIGGYDKTLTIDARKMVTELDTIFYNLQGLRTREYRLRFDPENLGVEGLEAFLVDRFTNEKSSLSLQQATEFSFTVTADPLSRESSRFYIVFKNLRPVPVSHIDISANRNRDGSVVINWKAYNEFDITRYELQRSPDSRDLFTIHNRVPLLNNGGTASYSFTDDKPLSSIGYYRIKAISINGLEQYSAWVKVANEPVKPGFSVYPNPVEGHVINLYAGSQQPGTYRVQLLNTTGQVVWNGSVNIQTGTAMLQMAVDRTIPAGAYSLVLSSPEGSRFTGQIILL